MKKFGHDIPETRLETGLLEPNAEHEALHPILVKEYREGGHYAGLMELFVDIDEGLQEWRYRHVKMAERTIGTKAGTGAQVASNIYGDHSSNRSSPTYGLSGAFSKPCSRSNRRWIKK